MMRVWKHPTADTLRVQWFDDDGDEGGPIVEVTDTYSDAEVDGVPHDWIELVPAPPRPQPPGTAPYTLRWFAFGKNKQLQGEYFDLVAEGVRRRGHPQISSLKIVDGSGDTVWTPRDR